MQIRGVYISRLEQIPIIIIIKPSEDGGVGSDSFNRNQAVTGWLAGWLVNG